MAATSSTSSVSTAEWTLNRNPIDTALWEITSKTEKTKDLIPPLVYLVVTYLESYECFGEREWNTLCGRVAPAPPLPEGFSDIWNGPCPIFTGKRVRDTHILVYLPTTVKEIPLTLNSFGAIAKRYFPTTANGYRDIWHNCARSVGELPTEKSCWILMTKNILPSSGNKPYDDQKQMVAELSNKILATYDVPKTLEAAVCILTYFLRSNITLFSETPMTYTRCQENIQLSSVECQIIIGGFSRIALNIDIDFVMGNADYIGIAALRRL